MRLFILALLLQGCFVWGDPIPPQRKIALLIREEFQGEISLAFRMQAACQNLQWKADIFDIFKFTPEDEIDYDFVIHLVPGGRTTSKKKHYLSIFHPLHHFFKKTGSLRKQYRGYDGYLLSFLPGKEKRSYLKQKTPYIRWYPSVQMREYKKVDPMNLFYLGSIWGNRFSDPKMQRFIQLLDQEKFTQIYGDPRIQTTCPRSYRARINFDSESICQKASEAGIVLVLHSSDHNAYGVPSGRIFEAAASSAVIICDENAFVKENFKDSVLYIDTSVTPEQIHHQVLEHVHWIQTNKEAALEKAKQAHEIYKSQFSLEDQLMQLGKFHDRLSKHNIFRWVKK